MKTITKSTMQSKLVSNRWRYTEPVITILKSWPDDWTVLELGPACCPLVPGSDTMDFDGATYNHDARILPWPVYKHYDVFVALQVFEHLGSKRSGVQEKVFEEVRRIATHIIVSIPYKWKKSKFPNHTGLDHRDLARWAGKTPQSTRIIAERLIAIW